MTQYNPDKNLNAAKWLAMDEVERIILVEDYHRRAGVRLPNAKVHATLHAVVENQLAESIPPVVDAFVRLTAEGLTRHETIHAIGLVLAEHMGALLRDDSPGADPNAAYEEAVRELTAKSWRAI